MPFKKVGTNDYTSPSGRHFNGAQVRLWYANDGKFPGQKGAGEMKTKFNSRPQEAEYLRGGAVQPESRSWAKSSSVKSGDMLKQPDAFRTDSGPGARQAYGKKGGSMGSGGLHGPNCKCAVCAKQYS